MLPRQLHRKPTEAGAKFRSLLSKAHHRLLLLLIFCLNHFVKLLSWEPDIPMWCANSNRLTWDHLTPPGTKGFRIFLASQGITADWHPSVGDRLLVPLLPHLRYILQMHHHRHLEAQVTTKKRKYCVIVNYALLQLRCKPSHNTYVPLLESLKLWNNSTA